MGHDLFHMPRAVALVLLVFTTCMWVVARGAPELCTRCKCGKVRSRSPKQDDAALGIRVSCAALNLARLEFLKKEDETLENLANLILRDNSLRVVPYAAFSSATGLKRLDLSHNKISVIEAGAFVNLTTLEKLDLSHNHLSALSSEIFQDLMSLQRLVLNHNAISWMPEGTLTVLSSLRQLDIENNPLICDCRLLWLVRWLKTSNVRVTPKSSCYLPEPFQGTTLTRMTRQNMHCNWPLQLPYFELTPRYDQLVFEGDAFLLECQVSRLDVDLEVTWLHDGDPIESEDIAVDKLDIGDGWILTGSSLRIGRLNLDHAGHWSCLVATPRGNATRSIRVVVVGQGAKFCPSVTTSDNKGEYLWPETLPGITVRMLCVGMSTGAPAFAYHSCSPEGAWEKLNTTDCPYVSEVTKVLEQFAKTNLSLSKTSGLESARGLRNYTRDGSILRDKMDVVFVARTAERYLRFVPRFREVGEVVLDVAAAVMRAGREVLTEAQREEGACSRLLRAIKSLSEVAPDGTFSRANRYLAIEEFVIKTDGFMGMTCASYLNRDEAQNMLAYNGWAGYPQADKVLHCSTANVTTLYEPNLLDASIRIPSSLFNLPTPRIPAHKLQFIVFRNAFLFPRMNHSRDVMSSIILCRVAGSGASFTNLSSPVEVTLRAPAYTDDAAPVWWDSEAADWVSGDGSCRIKHVRGNLVTFECFRLGAFGLLQDVDATLSRYGYLHGFRPCHPTVYIGSFIAVVCLVASIVIYVACFRVIQMPKKNKHAFINTCLSLTLLYLVFCAGVRQVFPPRMCQVVGLLLHYLTLSTLLWMLVAANNLYKELSKSDTPDVSPDEVPEPGSHPLPPKPMIRFYLVGWGIACIICGISAAVHLDNYGGPNYCFLGLSPSVATVYAPAAILVLLLFIFYLLTYCIVHGPDEAQDSRPLTNAPGKLSEAEDGASLSRRSSCPNDDDEETCRDTEHSHCSQLRSHVFVASLFLLNWVCAATATGRPLVRYVPADELIFGVFFCLFSVVLGVFVFTFYCYARQDVYRVLVRWFRFDVDADDNASSRRRPPPSGGDAVDETEDSAILDSSVAAAAATAGNDAGATNSVDSFCTSKSNPARVPSSLQSGKVLSVNLLSSHAAAVPVDEPLRRSPVEAFYDPRQVVVARRFFEKNRRRQRLKLVHKNDLGAKDVNLEAEKKNNNALAADSAGSSFCEPAVHVSSPRNKSVWPPCDSDCAGPCDACIHQHQQSAKNDPWVRRHRPTKGFPACTDDDADGCASLKPHSRPSMKACFGPQQQGSQTTHVNRAFECNAATVGHPPRTKRRRHRRASSRSSDRSYRREHHGSHRSRRVADDSDDDDVVVVHSAHGPSRCRPFHRRSQSAYEHVANNATAMMDVIEDSSEEGGRPQNGEADVRV